MGNAASRGHDNDDINGQLWDNVEAGINVPSNPNIHGNTLPHDSPELRANDSFSTNPETRQKAPVAPAPSGRQSSQAVQYPPSPHTNDPDFFSSRPAIIPGIGSQKPAEATYPSRQPQQGPIQSAPGPPSHGVIPQFYFYNPQTREASSESTPYHSRIPAYPSRAPNLGTHQFGRSDTVDPISRAWQDKIFDETFDSFVACDPFSIDQDFNKKTDKLTFDDIEVDLSPVQQSWEQKQTYEKPPVIPQGPNPWPQQGSTTTSSVPPTWGQLYSPFALYPTTPYPTHFSVQPWPTWPSSSNTSGHPANWSSSPMVPSISSVVPHTSTPKIRMPIPRLPDQLPAGLQKTISGWSSNTTNPKNLPSPPPVQVMPIFQLPSKGGDHDMEKPFLGSKQMHNDPQKGVASDPGTFVHAPPTMSIPLPPESPSAPYRFPKETPDKEYSHVEEVEKSGDKKPIIIQNRPISRPLPKIPFSAETPSGGEQHHDELDKKRDQSTTVPKPYLTIENSRSEIERGKVGEHTTISPETSLVEHEKHEPFPAGPPQPPSPPAKQLFPIPFEGDAQAKSPLTVGDPRRSSSPEMHEVPIDGEPLQEATPPAGSLRSSSPEIQEIPIEVDPPAEPPLPTDSSQRSSSAETQEVPIDGEPPEKPDADNELQDPPASEELAGSIFKTYVTVNRPQSRLDGPYTEHIPVDRNNIASNIYPLYYQIQTGPITKPIDCTDSRRKSSFFTKFRNFFRWPFPRRPFHPRRGFELPSYVYPPLPEYNRKPSRKINDYAFLFIVVMVLRQVYLHILLRLPSLYFSGVARIFEEADLTLREIKKMALETGLPDKGSVDLHTFESNDVPPQYTKLKSTWEAFIDSVMREWKTFNIISVLLLSAILTILQIQSAAENAITRYTALSSLICSLISLLFGCMYIIRFGTMRKTYKAAEWALEARQTRTTVWWNVWVLLAMPAIWLTWSIILYTACIMSFVWQSSASTDQNPPNQVSPKTLLAIRIIMTTVLGLGIIYGALILTTFRRYGEVMDNAWKRRINNWIEEKRFRNQSSYAPANGFRERPHNSTYYDGPSVNLRPNQTRMTSYSPPFRPRGSPFNGPIGPPRDTMPDPATRARTSSSSFTQPLSYVGFGYFSEPKNVIEEEPAIFIPPMEPEDFEDPASVALSPFIPAPGSSRRGLGRSRLAAFIGRVQTPFVHRTQIEPGGHVGRTDEGHAVRNVRFRSPLASPPEFTRMIDQPVESVPSNFSNYNSSTTTAPLASIPE